MANQTLSIVLEAVNKTKGTFAAVAGEIDQLDKKTQVAGTSVSGLGTKVGGLGVSFGAAVAASAGLAVGVGVLSDQFSKAISAASSMAETQSKLDVVFGASADQLRTWADTANTSMGMSEQAALEAAATLGNFAQALGVSQQEALKMSPAIVQLAGDMASFNNASPEQTLLALRSGLSGETEPLRAFGVALNAATVEAKAMEMGLARTKTELDEGDKVMARYALIMDQTKTAQGDFSRTSDSLANATRTLHANMEDLRAKVGEEVAPALAEAVSQLNKWMESEEGIQFTNDLAASMSGLATAVGSVGSALVGTINLMNSFAKIAHEVLAFTQRDFSIPLPGGWEIPLGSPLGRLSDKGRELGPMSRIGDAGMTDAEVGVWGGAAADRAALGPSGQFVLSPRNDITGTDFIKTLDIAFKSSAAEAEKAADKVTKAGASHSAGAAAISEAEKHLEDQRRQMASVTLSIEQTLRDEQMRALLDGGEGQLSIVRASQDAMMQKVHETADTFQQRLGVDMPTALQSAFALVAESTKKLAQETADAAQKQIDAQNRLRDATLGYIQSLASQNKRFAPGVLESIVASAPGLNDFGGYRIPSFATGGTMPWDGIAYLHKNEEVLTPAQQRAPVAPVYNLYVTFTGLVGDQRAAAQQFVEAVNGLVGVNGPVFVSNAVAP